MTDAATVHPLTTTPEIRPGNRSVTQEWLISSDTDDDGQPTRELASLNASHSAGRFTAMLRRVTSTTITLGGRTYPSTSCMLLDGIEIHRESVARYSDRGLASFAAHARGLLVARFDEPAIRAIFGHEAEVAPTPSVSLITIGFDDRSAA